MSPTLTLPYDAAAYLRTEEDCALYLQAVTEEANGDARLLDIALADIARARSRFDMAANPPGSNNPCMTSLTCWMDAWQQLGIAGGSELYASVHAAYQEPHRKYHTLQHLDECLLRFDEVKQHADHPAEVELALWFHDAIYDLARKDNELRSADWAKASIQACGLPAEIGSRVHSLIMMTVHNAVPAGRDAEALIDVDLSIFAAAPARFDEYEQQVRAEYVFVPEAVFRRERSRILQEFLQRERLYSTPYFREHHEPQARANLRRSISSLTG